MPNNSSKCNGGYMVPDARECVIVSTNPCNVRATARKYSRGWGGVMVGLRDRSIVNSIRTDVVTVIVVFVTDASQQQGTLLLRDCWCQLQYPERRA